MSAWNFKWFYYYFFFACFNKWLAVSEFHLNCRYFEVQDEVRSTNTRNWHGLKSSRNNWLAYFKQKATHKPVKFTHARLLAHTHTTANNLAEWMIALCGAVEVGTNKLLLFFVFISIFFAYLQKGRKIAFHSHITWKRISRMNFGADLNYQNNNLITCCTPTIFDMFSFETVEIAQQW